MEHDRRRALLLELLDGTTPTVELIAQLAKHPWDCEHPMVLMAPGQVRRALQRYLDGNATPEELELWAETLESRDDVGFEDGFEKLGRELLWELANPELQGPLSKDSARAILSRISSLGIPSDM